MKVVNIDPEIMGGAPVFNGTRVLVEQFVHYLQDGYGIETFLEQFPSVSRQHLVEFLRQSHESLIEKTERVAKSA
jgi:uncharacterized protein (DUF433 family)